MFRTRLPGLALALFCGSLFVSCSDDAGGNGADPADQSVGVDSSDDDASDGGLDAECRAPSAECPDVDPDAETDAETDTATDADAGSGDSDGGSDGPSDLVVSGDAGSALITPEAGGTVASSDGRFTLAFPAGAVSEAVEVSVAPVSPGSVPDLPGSVDAVAAFELLPHGLEQSEPAFLIYSSALAEHAHADDPAGEYRPLFAASVSRDGDEVTAEPLFAVGHPELDLFDTSIDLADETVTLNARLDHFSWVVVSRWDVSIGLWPGELDARVGERWHTRTVWNSHHERRTYRLHSVRMYGWGGVDVIWDDFPADAIIESHYPDEYQDELYFDADHMGLETNVMRPGERLGWTLNPRLICERPTIRDAGFAVASILIDSELDFEYEDWLRGVYEAEAAIRLEVSHPVRCTEPTEVAPIRCDPTLPQAEPLGSLGENLLGDEAALCAELLDVLGVDETVPTQHSTGVAPDDEGGGDEFEFVARGAVVAELGADVVDAVLNSGPYACDSESDARVICPDLLGDAEVGEFGIGYYALGAPFDVERLDFMERRYGFAFDANNLARDNFEAPDGAPNDFFQGSDQWYELVRDIEGEWSLEAKAVSGGEPVSIETEARAVIDGAVVALIVPTSEFEVSDPDYRVTAFGHNGDWGLEEPFAWRGDVSPPIDRGLAPFTWNGFELPNPLDCAPMTIELVDDPLRPGDTIAGLTIDPDSGACVVDDGDSFAANRRAFFLVESGRPAVATAFGHSIVDSTHGSSVGTIVRNLPDRTLVTARVETLDEVPEAWEVTFAHDLDAGTVTVHSVLEQR